MTMKVFKPELKFNEVMAFKFKIDSRAVWLLNRKWIKLNSFNNFRSSEELRLKRYIVPLL